MGRGEGMSSTEWHCSFLFPHAVSLPGSGVVPAGLFYPVPQDADIIGHHVIEGLELLLDSLQLHSFCVSLFGPVDKNKLLNFILLHQFRSWPLFPSVMITCCSPQCHDSHTYFSAIVFANRAFLRLFLSSIIFCSSCSCSRRVFSRLNSNRENFTNTNTYESQKDK